MVYDRSIITPICRMDLLAYSLILISVRARVNAECLGDGGSHLHSPCLPGNSPSDAGGAQSLSQLSVWIGGSSHQYTVDGPAGLFWRWNRSWIDLLGLRVDVVKETDQVVHRGSPVPGTLGEDVVFGSKGSARFKTTLVILGFVYPQTRSADEARQMRWNSQPTGIPS